MGREQLVQVALPVALVEDLLRRQELHAEQLQSLDGDSHRALTELVKRALLHGQR